MRHGGDSRGSSYSRRARRAWLLSNFGSGRSCPCRWCGKRLTNKTLTVDRVLPGYLGGSYRRENIVPACWRCNRSRFSKKMTFIPKSYGDYTSKEFDMLMRHEWGC